MAIWFSERGASCIVVYINALFPETWSPTIHVYVQAFPVQVLCILFSYTRR
jgi:hypothetical protein